MDELLEQTHGLVGDTNDRLTSLQEQIRQLRETTHTLEPVSTIQVNELHYREFGSEGDV